MKMNEIKIEIKVPFSTKRIAEIVYDVLRVDKEPKRSGVKKELIINQELYLNAIFSGGSLKNLRVAVNNFFENINLILSTIELFGPPVSESYDHY